MPELVVKVPPQPEGGEETKPTFNVENTRELDMTCEIHTTDFFSHALNILSDKPKTCIKPTLLKVEKSPKHLKILTIKCESCSCLIDTSQTKTSLLHSFLNTNES